MKKTLLFIFGCIASQLYSQNPITSFYGENNSSFNLLTSATMLDHSPTGTNQNWNFNQLINLGTSVKTNTSPTNSELSTYPNTTSVINSVYNEDSVITTSKLLTKTDLNGVSITGSENSGLFLNFTTNNVSIGLFPMEYGYVNNDNEVAGNYQYEIYSGTFTGVSSTVVDAYGVLSLDGSIIPFMGNVTRVKNVLTITLNYGFFSNVGSITQTIHSYYSNTITSSDPIFRSTVTNISVPLLSINQTETTLEKYQTTLSNDNESKLESFWIKNPITDQIEVNSASSIENATISITDTLGKTIYQATNQSINGTIQIPVSLTKGLYLVTVENENESITKKLIKN